MAEGPGQEFSEREIGKLDEDRAQIGIGIGIGDWVWGRINLVQQIGDGQLLQPQPFKDERDSLIFLSLSSFIHFL